MTVRFSLVVLLCATASMAQTGRSIALGVAPGLGVTSTYTATYPPSAAGRFGFFLLTLPEPTAQPLVLPGYTSSGLVRVDLNNQLKTFFWPLDGSGSQGFSVRIPMDYVFQGFSFDVQTVDADLVTNDIAWADNDLELTIGQGLVGQGLNMVRVPAGTFQMGSTAVGGTAAPVHAVTITRPFWVGKYEVTQAEYQAVMGFNPSAFQGASFPNAPQRPVERLTWSDAMAYCSALTATEAAAGRIPAGYQYRLPTEAEWEYVCRAGTTTEWNSGASLVCGQANFNLSFSGCYANQTTVVGSYPANPWGLFDTHGNVVELCLDSWDSRANYPSSLVSDPYVSSGPGRVGRGGSWNLDGFYCRSAVRGNFNPGFTYVFVGFRIVLAPILVP